MAEFRLCSPLTIPRPRARDLPLNLNEYRNAHFQQLNDMKKRFKGIMASQIEELPQLGRIQIEYTLYPKTKRLCDVANVLSVLDKFFCDALSELGKIEDDNYLYVPKVSYEIGEVDKNNPRAEILIKEIN
jgi:Holliday junction resolvase RusA-like endonuclease